MQPADADQLAQVVVKLADGQREPAAVPDFRDPRDLLALVDGQEFSTPGAKFAYANTNHVLLGLLIEPSPGTPPRTRYTAD
ncbi:hypothetical protein ACIBJE_22900 [Micromonospora sp. NPDC050187]|uniref:hypothetical protein n=1 Tax=Micromonospora sp. NPDC050187 TaxID=3364277 RepID=UPI0037958FFA